MRLGSAMARAFAYVSSMMSPRMWSIGTGLRFRFLLVGAVASCSSSWISVSSCSSPAQFIAWNQRDKSRAFFADEPRKALCF
jgi:hypothetical protein